jgi:integrating conjugative element protein (TIGR03758 family)
MSSMSAAQNSALQATGGFTAVSLSNLIVGAVLALLLIWGAWAVLGAYKGWARGQVDKSALVVLIGRFLLMYLVLLTLMIL